MGLLIDVWKTMSNQRVIQTTRFKFSLKDENENNMLVWYEEINMYVATKDANNTFKELLNMIKINNYSIKISIKLKEGRVIQFKT
jgi:oligoribonuclease NrnB/cAMP/cGMP phosphodiesterase (DHH superfamily)